MSTTKYRKVIFMLLADWASLPGGLSETCQIACACQKWCCCCVWWQYNFWYGLNSGELSSGSEQMIGRRWLMPAFPEKSLPKLIRLPQILESEKPALLILCHAATIISVSWTTGRPPITSEKWFVWPGREALRLLWLRCPVQPFCFSGTYVQDIAKEFKIPLEEKTLPDILADNSLKSDYIHPNAAGYRRLAEAVAALLKKSGAID